MHAIAPQPRGTRPDGQALPHHGVVCSHSRDRRAFRLTEEDPGHRGAGFMGSPLCGQPYHFHKLICAGQWLDRQPASYRRLPDNRMVEATWHDMALPPHIKVDEIYNLARPALPVHDRC